VQGMENGKLINRNIETVGAIIIATIFLFWFFLFPEIKSEQIGSYPVQRQVDGTLIPLNRTIYKVNPLMQTIIYWMPGIDETPRKLVNCAIRNRKNWVGYYLDGSGAVKMRKGKFVTDDPNDIYVGRCRWWLLHFDIL